jgi:DNA-binding NarL/FixJ family response regulator
MLDENPGGLSSVPIREALRGVLKELRDDITVLEAADSSEAMRLIEEHPDLGLIVLNLNLPDRDGFSVLSEICINHPAISVVVMSAQEDHDNVVKALNQGALGFIPKSATREVILGAMRLVISGGVYIPPQPGASTITAARGAFRGRASEGWGGMSMTPPASSRRLPCGVGNGSRASTVADAANGTRPRTDRAPNGRAYFDHARGPGFARNLGLTELQMDVLTLLTQGSSKEDICGELGFSEPTLKNHVNAILRALSPHTPGVLARVRVVVSRSVIT